MSEPSVRDTATPDVPAPDATAGEATPRRRRWLRRALWSAAALALLLLTVAGVAALWFRGRLVASLPVVEGERPVAGLGAPVTVLRDDLGVPTVRGADRLDVARGLGFLHGQERFFQMDLMLRRRAAGETAALVGERGLAWDRRVRIHRFRRLAEQVVERLPARQRAVLEAYADGVNAGLEALDAPPFEYALLLSEPEPWRPEDSLLAVYAMYLELHTYTIELEDNLDFMHELLAPEVYRLLTPLGTEWDSPMVGPAYTTSEFAVVAGTETPGEDAARDDAAATDAAPAAPPGAAPADPRRAALRVWDDDGNSAIAGSNAWALAPRRTADGRALLANDMHLPLTVPALWYRASLEWPRDGGGRHRVTGVTLPGLPMVIAGSNGRVAWGLTASLVDVADLVLLEPDPQRDDRYLTPDGPQAYGTAEETIRVRGGDDVTLGFLTTRWGPVLPDGRLDRDWALAWVAYDPEAMNLGALGLETADSVEEALDVANRAGAPAQNIVAADADGHVGWSILGRVPRRVGHSGRLPVSWADGTAGWDGLLPPERVPRIVDPDSGMVWNANNRSVDGEAYALLGDGGYRSGARAHQIHDVLTTLDAATPDDMRHLQRDDRAVFLTRWHRFLTERVLTPENLEGHPQRAAFRDAVATWEGEASVDSVSFTLVRAYRFLLAQTLFDAFTGELREIDPTYGHLRYPHFEEPLWHLASEQPAGWLPEGFESWNELLLRALDTTVTLLGRQRPGEPLSALTWGSANTLDVGHPLSRALPFVGRWLDMPARPMPGAEEMPLAQRRDYGASVRMVVSPGHEAEGTTHIPMGQSGHPLSPHYDDAFPTWAGDGEPTPFLPGPPVHTLVLEPRPATDPEIERRASN